MLLTTTGGGTVGQTSGPVERLRGICSALPSVTERPSHGEPTWFVNGNKTVVTLDDHHHGADRLAFWCPAAPGVQEEMVDADPDTFFRPPFVGHLGWLGVRIDLAPDWAEIEQIVRDAYRRVATKRLIAEMEAG